MRSGSANHAWQNRIISGLFQEPDDFPVDLALHRARLAKSEPQKTFHFRAGPRGGNPEMMAAKSGVRKARSAVAQSFRGTLPLRDIVGDHAGRFHCGLAELGIARNFALNALTFGM